MEENKSFNRRNFIKTFSALAGSSLLLSSMPWLNTIKAEGVGKTVRLGMLGIGVRGKLHLLHLLQIPDVKLVCVCDNYEPHLNQALSLIGEGVKGYTDYMEMFEKEDFDAILIATPLHEHERMTLDAFKYGLHVFCEKSMAISIEQCNNMVRAQQEANKILHIGHQRIFSLKYIQAYQQIKEGKLGDIKQIRAYWHRNNDWRRPVPADSTERKVNWRLYREYSAGLMTELASHQIQVANQIYNETPEAVWGCGGINYWKDGRELEDNVNLVYKYPGGSHLMYDSMISNKHYGLEEQILGSKGTFELENGKHWEESPPPAPGILKLINHIENKVFDTIPLGGASWIPETAENKKGNYIMDEVMEDDGTRMMLEAFVANVRENRIDQMLMKEGFYATVAALMGYEAILENKIVYWPKDLIL
jgi:predicted dehydrogenase